MRKIVYIVLSCLLLLGCSKESINQPTNNNDFEESRPNSVDVGTALVSIGYESVDNVYVRRSEDHGNDFLYVFYPTSGDFQMIELPSLRVYKENVRVDSDTYVNSIMNQQLVHAKLNPSLFGNEVVDASFDASSYIQEYTMLNLHQVFLNSGYKESNGFYEKHFDGYSLAFNVKGKAITLYKNGTFYRYLSDSTGLKYGLTEGYCSYNLYKDLVDNCVSEDVNEITSHYDSIVHPELVRLGLRLFDLDVYYDAMVKLKWDEVRKFEPNRFPLFDKSIFTPDPESESYFNLMLSYRDAIFTDYSISVKYGNTNGVFYYEDKTFKLTNSKAVYNFGNDIGFYDGCSYNFKNGKGSCNDAKISEIINVKNAMYGVLDRANLNVNELQLCFNVTGKYDKTIATEVGG